MKNKQSESEARFAYQGLDRVIHERARLSVLTSLITHASGLSFVDLKRLCDLTDGNLARHLQVLEDEGMIESSKQQDKNRTQTVMQITAAGRKRYLEYLNVLEQVVRDAAAVAKESPRPQTSRKLAPVPG